MELNGKSRQGLARVAALLATAITMPFARAAEARKASDLTTVEHSLVA